jgi:hypothetical protein
VSSIQAQILVLQRTYPFVWINFYSDFASVGTWVGEEYRRFECTHERAISIAAKAMKAGKLRRAWT